MKRTLTPLVLACLVMLGVPHHAVSQITAGTLSGEVRNNANEPVSGAKVTVRSLSTNQSRSALTDDEGAYRVSAVPVGAYEITIEAGNCDGLPATDLAAERECKGEH
jgi:hypothetical protein